MLRTDLNDLMNRCCEMTTVEGFERLLSDNNCHATAAEIDYEYINRYGFVDIVENDTNDYMFRVRISRDDENEISVSDAIDTTKFFDGPALFENDVKAALLKNGYCSDEMTMYELDEFMMTSGYMSAEEQFEEILENPEHTLTYTMFTYSDYDTAAEIELRCSVTETDDEIRIRVIDVKIL